MSRKGEADQVPRPTSVPATPALFGRERELVMLRAAIAGALAGKDTLVLIGGEARIGKTALAEVALAEARVLLEPLEAKPALARADALVSRLAALIAPPYIPRATR